MTSLLAIGPFSFQVEDCLDFGPAFYIGTKRGTKIITTVLVCPTTSLGDELARALGISLWDFNQHFFDGGKINWDGLHKWMKENEDVIHNEYKRCRILANNGFTFIYRPGER